MCANDYENWTMLSRVTAKNVRDVFEFALSWDEYCAVMLCEAVTVCCIVKTALTSETF